MAVSPSDPAVIYAAFEDVGVFRSSDNGLAFETEGVDSFSSQTVTCLAVHPTNPEIVLAGTFVPYIHVNKNQVAIWRSIDGAKTWTSVKSPGYNSTGINAIAFSPDDPEVVLAGVNTGDSQSVLYRSTNGGLSWANLPATAFGANIEHTGITALIFDSNTPGRVLAGFTGRDDRYNFGLHESTDYGVSWQRISVEPFTGPFANPVFSLLQLPDRHSTLFAGTSIESTHPKTHPLWRSDDGGQLWFPATTEFNSRSTTVTGFYRLAYHPDYPNTLWVSQSPVISKPEPYYGVWPNKPALLRTDNLGASWEIVQPSLSGASYPADTLQALIARGGDAPQLVAGFTGLGLWRLNTGDRELQYSSAQLPFGTLSAFAATGENQLVAAYYSPKASNLPLASGLWSGTHYDWQSATGIPSGSSVPYVLSDPLNNSDLLAVADSNLYRSQDAGLNWAFQQHQMAAIASAARGTHEVFLASGNGLLKSSDFGNTSTPLGMGLGYAVPMDIEGDSTGSRIAVAASYSTGPIALGSGVFISEDGGTTFRKSNKGIPYKNNLENLLWAPNGNDVYATEEGALLHSHNRGTNWSPTLVNLKAIPGSPSTFVPKAVTDLQTGVAQSTECLWLLTADTSLLLHRSIDNGITWEAIAPVGVPRYPTLNQISCMAVSKSIPTHVWALTRTMLAKSTDGGDTWSTRTLTYPVSDGAAFAVDDTNEERMFMADESRMYRSLDGGISWTNIALPLELNRIRQIVLPVGHVQRVVASDDRNIWNSEDNGIAWMQSSNTSIVDSANISVSSADNSIMYAVDGVGTTLRSNDAGYSWNLWYDVPYTSYNMKGMRLAVSPTTSTELLFSKPDDTIYRTINSGRDWVEASVDLRNSRVTAVAISPADSDVMYAGTRGSGIYKSTDGGNTWIQSLRQVFDFKVNDLEINTGNPDECVAATDWGLQYTSDAGGSWQLLTNDLDDSEIRKVQIIETNSGMELFAATAHSGIWTNRQINRSAAVQDWQLFQ